jgi:competence protein ComEA
MWRSMRWMIIVSCAVGLLSGGVSVAQDKSATVSDTPAAALKKARTAADKMSTAGGKAATVTEPVDLNTADAATLQSLQGIGAVQAKAIVAYRQQHGPFQSVDDLKKVPGIGDKLLATLRDQVTVGE